MSRLTELLLCLLLCRMYCADTSAKISVDTSPNGYRLTCPEGFIFSNNKGNNNKTMELEYNDAKSGQYTCQNENDVNEMHHIFVKFRTCDNCIEMDVTAIVSLVVGNVVATVLIGVAVYLVASQSGPGPLATNKKRSDRQPLVPNENTANSSTYQELQKNRTRDEYGVLKR